MHRLDHAFFDACAGLDLFDKFRGRRRKLRDHGVVALRDQFAVENTEKDFLASGKFAALADFRGGDTTWANEQALNELAKAGFRLAAVIGTTMRSQ